jgi:hypothetical protein
MIYESSTDVLQGFQRDEVRLEGMWKETTGNVSAFTWRSWGRRRLAVRVADVPGEIRADHLNTSRNNYRLSISLYYGMR